MSLYLKYRPMDFSSVVGQEHVVTTLQNALKNNALTHAYLFEGSRGTGKTSMARIIAKALNCTKLINGIEPCNQCDICRSINKGRLVDMIEIDAASNRGIDEIRDLREKIQFSPTQARTKVYIIDEVHMLTKEAFNALLKTLEEPPEHAYFILATTETHKIPETIISRCQQFNFKRIAPALITKRLKQIAVQEGIEAESEALELITRMANGGLRDAIGLLEQMNLNGKVQYREVAKNLGLTGPVQIELFFQAILNRDAKKALEILNEVNTQGQNLNQFTSELIGFLREQMLLSLDRQDQVRSVIRLIEIFSEAKNQINQALIPQLPVEIAVAKACMDGVDSVAGQPAAAGAREQKAAEQKKTPEPAAAAKPAEAPRAEDAADAVEIAPDVNLESIKQSWQRVIDHIETPFIKMSFLDGEPVKYNDGKLEIAFKSITLKDKVAKSANQDVVLRAFEHVLKFKPHLDLTMKKIELKPLTGNFAPKKAEPSIIDMAKEVFGA